MKKSVLAVVIAVWVVIAGLLIWFMVYNWNGDGVSMFGVQFGVNVGSELLKEETLSAEGVAKVVVEGRSWSVKLQESDGRDFHVAQYGGSNTPDSQLFSASKDGDTLRITISSELNIMIGMNIARQDLVISVPSDWDGSMDARANSGGVHLEDDFQWGGVALTTTSGSIRTLGLRCGSLRMESSSGGIRCSGEIKSAGDVEAKATSGSIRMNGNVVSEGGITLASSSGGISSEGSISAGKSFSASTSSGSIRLRNTVTADGVTLSSSSGGVSSDGSISAGKSFNASTTSGSIRLNNPVTADDVTLSSSSGGVHTGEVNTARYSIRTTSGSIRIDGISGGGKMESSSGGVTATLMDTVGDADISATSGSVRLTVPSWLSFTFEGKTGSGSIRTDFDTLYGDKNGKSALGTVGDSPTANIEVRTGSGGIHVNMG